MKCPCPLSEIGTPCPICKTIMSRQKPFSANDALIYLKINRTKCFHLSCSAVPPLNVALHVICISKFAPKADAINLTIVQIALTALLSLVAMPIAKEPFSFSPFAVWGSALFLGVVATAFSLAVMNWVHQFVSSTKAAMFYALALVCVSILGHFAGDNLSLLGWIGCGCMLSSMVVGELRLSRI